jgi:hypothetical protein
VTIDAALAVTPEPESEPDPTPVVDMDAVRAFAESYGLRIDPDGNVEQTVIDRYLAAHPITETTPADGAPAEERA